MSIKALACGAAALLVLAVLADRPAVAQPAADPEPAVGQRLRVTLLPTRERLVATLVSTSDDRMTLQPDSPSARRQLRWSDVGRLQVSRGRHRNTLKGVLAGAAAWAATVGLVAAFDTLDESGLGEPLVIGGYLATGALVGSLVKSESWSELPLPSAGRRGSRGRPGLRFEVAVRF